MKTIAFMQSPNLDLLPAEEDRKRYITDPIFHREMLMQSMSGIRLRQAFGPFFDEVWWDNVNPDGNHVSQSHVDRVLAEQRPDLILTFGNEAHDAILNSVMAIRCKIMSCHHPNARFKCQSDLDNFAAEVRTWVMTQEREAD